MKFSEYLLKEEGYDIPTLLTLFAQALQANSDPKILANQPLIAFGDNEQDIMRKLTKNAQLSELIQSNPAAIQAIQDCRKTKLTLDSLAGLLAATLSKTPS
jgi:hypothetical protein